jgi:hypothetical protein
MRKRIGIGAGCLWVFLCSGGSAQTGGINLDANTRAEIENGMDEQISPINHKAPIDVGPQQKLLRAARHGEIVIYTYELTIGQEAQASPWACRPSAGPGSDPEGKGEKGICLSPCTRPFARDESHCASKESP